MILSFFPTVWFEEFEEQVSGVVPPLDLPYLVDENDVPYVDSDDTPYILP